MADFFYVGYEGENELLELVAVSTIQSLLYFQDADQEDFTTIKTAIDQNFIVEEDLITVADTLRLDQSIVRFTPGKPNYKD
ncbi:hypothetical protein [Sphingobacterium siyangense]|uniref:Uncharacterized protein n=1 Tax=Sphingobacterium siyangense TaxID=459529 RepID=A0A562N0H8_9SPHI|nr:hypothetical protein [Sphingobacterium siyangense]TWI25568.1 hypothetical protein IQ31_00133 [Sphingobacterium siyangense]